MLVFNFGGVKWWGEPTGRCILQALLFLSVPDTYCSHAEGNIGTTSLWFISNEKVHMQCVMCLDLRSASKLVTVNQGLVYLNLRFRCEFFSISCLHYCLRRAKKAVQGLIKERKRKIKVRNRECGWPYIGGGVLNWGEVGVGGSLRKWNDPRLHSLNIILGCSLCFPISTSAHSCDLDVLHVF